MLLFLTDEFCEEYPHAFIPTPGYYIECQNLKRINLHKLRSEDSPIRVLDHQSK